MKKIVIALAAGLLIGGTGELAAQDEVAANATITIPTLLSIDVTNTAVTFDQPTVDDWDTGYIPMNSDASVVSTRGNVEHNVTVQADEANMSLDGAASTKPSTDLEWDAGSGFAGLTATEMDVVTGLARGAHNAAATLVYRMVLDPSTDAPGTYDLDFTFTVVAN